MENLFDYQYNNMADALNHRYGISYDATSQKIFTLQKNAQDTHNPMGFYHYTGTSLSHNKAFMVIDNSAVPAGAKIYFGYQGGISRADVWLSLCRVASISSTGRK